MNALRHALPTDRQSYPDLARIDPTRPTASRRIYAIGDIHGHAAHLSQMHDAIAEDLKRHPVARHLIVYLGDIIDRGPDSQGVVEMVVTRLETSNDTHEVRCLRGNHEDFLVRFLSDPAILRQWVGKGGLETLMSYGLAEDEIRAAATSSAGARDMQRRFSVSMPERHKNCMITLPYWHMEDGYFFVHAGIDPDRTLVDQQLEDMIWIRDKFLKSERDFGKVVVHGHSINRQVQSLPNRINVDTGIYMHHVLSCVILEGADRHLLQVGPMPAVQSLENSAAE